MPVYKSNSKKIINDLTKKFEKLNKTEVDRMARIGAVTLLGNIGNRVFQDGEASNEGLIGSYSTKDILVGKSSFVKKSTANQLLGSKAKRRKLEWVTKNGKRLAILPGGYAQLRALQGRQTSKVDLHMTGKLFNDFVVSGKRSRYFLGFRSEYGKTISIAQETRFSKPIFNTSDTERKELVNIFENGINTMFR